MNYCIKSEGCKLLEPDSRKQCYANSPSGSPYSYVCTRTKEHLGQHHAGGSHTCYGTWEGKFGIWKETPSTQNKELKEDEKPMPKVKEKAERKTGILENILQDFIEENRLSKEMIVDEVAKAVQRVVPVPTYIQIQDKEGQAMLDVGLAHNLFGKLVKIVESGRSAYLYGAPGSGKSTAVAQVAKAMSLNHAYGSLNPQTPESRLIGFMHAGGQYVETEFYRTYRDGGVFCLDELDNASPSLLNTLNSLLANGHGSFPCGTIPRHKDFILIATGNTNGNGASVQFPDRRAFDPAFKDRFVCLEWNYDEELEKAVCLAINSNAFFWYEFIKSVRKHVFDNQIQLVVSPRATFDGAALLEKFTIQELSDMVLFKGLDKDTVAGILREVPLPKGR